MKTKYLTALAAGAMLLCGCRNAIEYHSALYITEATTSEAKTMVLDGEGETVSVSVTAAQPVAKDVTVRLAAAPELVAEYNAKYGRECEALTDFEFAADEVKIAAGKNVSESVEITVNQTLESGKFYCLPLKIVSSDSDLAILEPSSRFFLIMRSAVKSKAIYIGSSNKIYVPTFAAAPDFGDLNLHALNELTLECRVYVNAFKSTDPYISSVMGAEGEVCMRFGDVKIGKEVLQVCKGDYQPAATNAACQTKMWYHVAAVWSRSALKVYIDGKLVAETANQGETVDIAGVWLTNASRPEQGGIGFCLGAASVYNANRPLDGYLGEARVWTRALSTSEISNNKDLVVVDPQSPDLLAYWRLDKAEIFTSSQTDDHFRKTCWNKIEDLTGHGYDAFGESRNPSFIDTVW